MNNLFKPVRNLNRVLAICRPIVSFIQVPDNKLPECRTGQKTINKLNLKSNFDGLKHQQIRYKKTHHHLKGKNTSKRLTEDDDSGEEYESGDDEEVDTDNVSYIDNIDTSSYHPGFKVVQKSFPSLRYDSVISTGLNLSRNKIEDYFYSSKLKLNGEKVTKKSAKVRVGDRLDLIGEVDETTGKRGMRRVFVENIFEPKSETKRARAILVVWKTGLFEEDSYKKHL